MAVIENYKLEGDLLDIVKYPAPVLSKVAAPVTEFNEDLEKLARNMAYTMYQAPGVGLAAPQIGKSIRLFVIDTEYEREEVTLPNGDETFKLDKLNPMVFINPKITSKCGEQTYEEGCLSLPGIFENVKRAAKIKVEYQNLKGEKCELEAEGLFAVCIQHENDHLDGKVFIDRISLMKRNLIKKKLMKRH